MLATFRHTFIEDDSLESTPVATFFDANTFLFSPQGVPVNCSCLMAVLGTKNIWFAGSAYKGRDISKTFERRHCAMRNYGHLERSTVD